MTSGATKIAIKVVHIDDEYPMLELVKLMFANAENDIVLEQFVNPLDAIERIKQGDVDVIVSDFQMPELDGLAVLERLRSEGNDTPFIILTGKGREEVAIKALNLGASFYLEKGWDAETMTAELLNLIQRAYDHRVAEFELRREKEFTEMALDSQNDIFFVFNRVAKKAIRWNKAFRDITGYTDDEIARMPAPDSYFEVHELEKASGTTSKVSNGDTVSISIDLICKGGKRVPYEFQVNLLKGSNPENPFLVVVGRNLTEIRESEAKYKLLYNNALIALGTTRMSDSKILECNKNFADLFGFDSIEDVIQNGYAIDLYTTPDDRVDAISKISEQDMITEIRQFKKVDGTPIWIQYTARTNAEKDTVEIAALDITQRIDMEKSLELREALFASLHDHLPVAYAFHRMIYDENDQPVDYEFIEVNPLFEELTGLKASDIVSKKVTEVLPGIEKDAADWIGRYGKVVQTGESITFKQYSDLLEKYYNCTAYRPIKGHFAVIFTEIEKYRS